MNDDPAPISTGCTIGFLVALIVVVDLMLFLAFQGLKILFS